MNMAEKKIAKIAPELPGGFRDYPPKVMIPRMRMIETIRETFERFGFDQLETPGMERTEVLTPEQSTKVIYHTTTDPDRTPKKKLNEGDEERQRTALRFDLTVPLARFVAASISEIRLPFKRYQYGNVWRGEKTQAGRFREFMQFDADTIGSDSMLADAEIIALMVETMRALAIDQFQVRFNNRKLLNGLAELVGFEPTITTPVLRIIDKLPKIGRDAVLRELQKPPLPEGEFASTAEGADDIESEYGLGFTEPMTETISKFLDLSGSTDVLLQGASDLFCNVADARRGIEELQEIVTALRAMNVPETFWVIDLSVARGLDYYTGPVFETFLTELPEFGSVFSGGRYDGLVQRFLNDAIPATGASVGVDRLFAALEKLGRVKGQQTKVQVLVAIMDPTLTITALRTVGTLRNAGIRTAFWLGRDSSFKAQLAYATAMDIPCMVLIGKREVAAGTVTVKNMTARTQQTVRAEDVVPCVQDTLPHVA